MVFAPISATGIHDQGVLMDIMTLTNKFWTMMIAGYGWHLALRVIVWRMMAIELVNKSFRLGFVWFGRPGKEPPDALGQSYFSILKDTVYVPLVEPILDNMQDSCWRLILSVRRIVKWDLWIVLLHAYSGTIRETGTDLFTKPTTLASAVPVRYKLNSRKQPYWWWTRSCTASCSVACFSLNKNANS